MHDPDVLYSQKTKRLRIKLNLTQAQFAERLGVPTTTYSNWERNICLPNLKHFGEMSEADPFTMAALSDIYMQNKMIRD